MTHPAGALWFSVLVEARPDAAAPGISAVDLDDLLDAWAVAVEAWAGAAGATQRSWSVRLSVQEPGAAAAAASALALATSAAAKVGLPPWPVVRLKPRPRRSSTRTTTGRP